MGDLSQIELLRRIIVALQQGPGILSGVIHQLELKNEGINEYDLIPNMHVLVQTASSTACGWGGIGGQAFTNFYLIILEYEELYKAVVFIGRAAYVCYVDDEYRKLLEARKMPLWDRVSESKLNILWKATK